MGTETASPETVTNFRDFGGYATADSHLVRSGLLFRSNQFSRVSDEDWRAIESLGIKAVVDLRSERERNAQPTPRRFASAEQFLSKKPDTDFIFAEIFAITERTEQGWAAAFEEFYARLPFLYADEYRAMFDVLARGDLPILIHCSAGKDRTGVACALILDLLSVDRDTIVEDYLASSRLLDGDAHFRNMFTDARLDSYAGLPVECRNVMLGTRRDYLMNMLVGVEGEFGSVERYLVDGLGLPHDTGIRIRSLLRLPVS